MFELDANYYKADILKQMRVNPDGGYVSAYGWIKAAVNIQNKIAKRSDSEVMSEIRTIIQAFNEADKQYAKELNAKLNNDQIESTRP